MVAEHAAANPTDGGSSHVSNLPQLRNFTPARVSVGRAGDAVPTVELLDFQLAHARARDAVHAAFDSNSLAGEITKQELECIVVRTQAANRTEYLRRPDLGRKLDIQSNAVLASRPPSNADVVFVIADGLSALAVERHTAPLLGATLPLLSSFTIGPVIIAEQGRVALGDQIGELLSAKITAVLIGERPGMSAPDSLGVYLTFDPRPGRTDAERNCISNIRPEGLEYDVAARQPQHSSATHCTSESPESQDCSSAEGPYTEGTGRSFRRRYKPSCARW